MSKRNQATLTALLLLTAALGGACTAAEADPLEVTYYYLPG